jgi:hypothetical protein
VRAALLLGTMVAAAGGADLGVAITGEGTLRVGTPGERTVTVTNGGPDPATAASVTVQGTNGLGIAGIEGATGPCETAGPNVYSCPLGDLPPDTQRPLTVRLMPGFEGTAELVATTTSTMPDPALVNNEARQTIFVAPALPPPTTTPTSTPTVTETATATSTAVPAPSTSVAPSPTAVTDTTAPVVTAQLRAVHRRVFSVSLTLSEPATVYPVLRARARELLRAAPAGLDAGTTTFRLGISAKERRSLKGGRRITLDVEAIDGAGNAAAATAHAKLR